MNARELHDKLEYEHKAGLRWLFSSDAQERETVLRALRLLAAAEGGDGTPETDALAKMCSTQFQLTEIARSFERERNGLAARVGELEKDAERYRWLREGHPTYPALSVIQASDKYGCDIVLHMEHLDAAIDAARSAP